MKIIVDADATPKSVLEICRQAAKFPVSLVTVAGKAIRPANMELAGF